MAIFRPGPLIGAISGDLGAINFRATRGTPTVALRSSKSRRNTPQTALVRAGLERTATRWEALTDAQRQAWTDYAAFLHETNRLGVSRRLSGRQAQSKFILLTDAYARGGVAGITPPLNGRFPTPSILSSTWSAAGTQTITFDFSGLPYSRLYLWGHQHYQYGPRAGAGALMYMGTQALNANPLNVTATLSNFGVEIYAGEQINLRTHLWAADYFPSFDTFHVVTVTA